MAVNRLSPQQKKKRRKRILITCIVVALVLAAVTVGLVFLQRSITEKYAEQDETEILTAVVETGSIRTTVSGSGSLSYESSESVVLPAKVLLDQVFVRMHETVEEGQLLATVNNESVIAAMAELQTSLDDLDAELSEAESDEADSDITAAVSGRVKAIHATAGEDVSSVMYEDGSLMLLSLDGYMKLVLDLSEPQEEQKRERSGSREPSGETEQAEPTPEPTAEPIRPEFAVGDEVLVTEEDGDTYDGVIDRVAGDAVTVLLDDYGPEYGAEATVSIGGLELGKGVLGIHEPLAITGYVGTVDSLYVVLNEWVTADETLLTLSNTSYTAHYESLLKQRQELEEDLQALIAIYQEGGLYAPVAGKIDSLSYDSRTTTASNADTDILTVRPSESIVVTVYVDESDILSLSVGQEAVVTVSSIEDESFIAEVTEVGSEGSSSGGVTQYAVTMSMERVDNMRSGMTATAAISISGAENALLLPEDAVQKDRNNYYVYTARSAENGELTGMVNVEVGISGNGNIEILSGLKEGDLVYYVPSASEEFSFGGRGFGSGEMPGGRR